MQKRVLFPFMNSMNSALDCCEQKRAIRSFADSTVLHSIVAYRNGPSVLSWIVRSSHKIVLYKTDTPYFRGQYNIRIRSSRTKLTVSIFADSTIFAYGYCVQNGVLRVKRSSPHARQRCEKVTAACNIHGRAKKTPPCKMIFLYLFLFFCNRYKQSA